MKGSKIIAIIAIVAASLLVIGIGIAAIGIAAGGHYYNGETSSFDNAITEKITSMDISVEYGTLEFKEGDEFRVVAENFRENTLEWEVSDGCLTIKEDSSKSWWNFNFGWFNNGPKLTVYVKEGTQLDHLELAIGAGELTGSGLSAKSMTLDCGAGEIDIDQIDFCENMDVSCGAGSVKIGGNITGNINIDNGVGEVDLKLTGAKENYSIYASSGITSVKVNGQKYRQEDFPSGADNTINISNGIGEVTIDFAS